MRSGLLVLSWPAVRLAASLVPCCKSLVQSLGWWILCSLYFSSLESEPEALRKLFSALAWCVFSVWTSLGC